MVFSPRSVETGDALAQESPPSVAFLASLSRALVLLFQSPFVSVWGFWSDPHPRTAAAPPGLFLQRLFQPCPHPTRLSLCHQSPAWLKNKCTSCVWMVFLLIKKLGSFFPMLLFLLCTSQTPKWQHMLLLLVCVPAQTCPVSPLRWLHCCPVGTGVTNSAYSFIPACSEDHACGEMLQAAERMKSVLWNVSVLWTLWCLWEKQTHKFPHRKKAWKILISSGAFSLSV